MKNEKIPSKGDERSYFIGIARLCCSQKALRGRFGASQAQLQSTFSTTQIKNIPKQTSRNQETHVKRGSRLVRKTKPNEKKMTGTQKIKRASWIILSLLIQT
ncbi:MAG: hypothetical protein ACLSIL_17950 [Enterococcus casseliflavus]